MPISCWHSTRPAPGVRAGLAVSAPGDFCLGFAPFSEPPELVIFRMVGSSLHFPPVKSQSWPHLLSCVGIGIWMRRSNCGKQLRAGRLGFFLACHPRKLRAEAKFATRESIMCHGNAGPEARAFVGGGAIFFCPTYHQRRQCSAIKAKLSLLASVLIDLLEYLLLISRSREQVLDTLRGLIARLATGSKTTQIHKIHPTAQVRPRQLSLSIILPIPSTSR